MSTSKDLNSVSKAVDSRQNLEHLLQAHQDRVYALCHRVLRHHQDAEDATQQVLWKLANERDRITDEDHLQRWLHTVAIHTALDVRRKRARRLKREMEARPLPETEKKEETSVLRRSMGSLDAESREMLSQYHLEGRTLKDMALQRGYSTTGIWKHIQRAYERLRESVKVAGLSMLAVGWDQIMKPFGLLRAPRAPLSKAGAARAVSHLSTPSSGVITGVAAVTLGCAVLLMAMVIFGPGTLPAPAEVTERALKANAVPTSGAAVCNEAVPSNDAASSRGSKPNILAGNPEPNRHVDGAALSSDSPALPREEALRLPSVDSPGNAPPLPRETQSEVPPEALHWIWVQRSVLEGSSSEGSSIRMTRALKPPVVDSQGADPK